MSFGDRLRRAREERRFTLDDLATRTKIKRHLLADLEDDDLTRWPNHLVYRHGHVRSIAGALGLDADCLLDRFDEAFPEYSSVAFDGGGRWRKSRAPRAPTVSPSPAVVALMILLGLLASLALSVGFGRTVELVPAVTGPPANADPAIAYAGLDITLEPAAVGDLEPAGVRDLEPAVVEGEVRVVSNPADAFVTVNGIGRGRTPVRVRYLPLGAHTIRVTQFGYKARESHVTLTSDEPVGRVRVALRETSDTGRRSASR
jgi:transcriptional regulator with XRE-family HTH domain